MHAVKAPASSEHSNVTPGSSAEKLNVAHVLLVVAAGPPEASVVSGAVVSGSTVHE